MHQVPRAERRAANEQVDFRAQRPAEPDNAAGRERENLVHRHGATSQLAFDGQGELRES